MQNRHGGDLDIAKRLFPQVTSSWLDLSTGINPFSYPVPVLDPSLYERLPASLQEDSLRQVAACYYGCKDKRYVAIAPGTQILISLLPYLLPAEEVCVLCPTYAEYVSSWHQKQVKIHKAYTLEQFMCHATKPKSIGILCNPNNPDGRLLNQSQLDCMLETWNKAGNPLVIDEAYMDFAGPGMADRLADANLVILRSFGKTYGLAGLRLGFLLARPEVVQKIQKMMGCWSVSGPALQIALQALQDGQWFGKTGQALHQQQNRFDVFLSRHQIKTVGKTFLFRLIRHEQAMNLWRFLASQGIWVRQFDYELSWLRFGALSNEQDWKRLEKAFSIYFND